MSNYYFLASALPPLQIGQNPEMDFRQFLFLLQANLSKSDLNLTRVIQHYDDIQNIRAFWLNERLDPHGSLDARALEEGLAGAAGFPDYVYAFLEKYESQKERQHFFPRLIREYFDQEIERSTGFLQQYLRFERDLRSCFVAFRRKEKYDCVELQVLFETHKDDPLGLQRALEEYRFQWVEKMYGVHIFSIDRILAYMIQLRIVERWNRLDQKEGMQKLRDVQIL